MKKNIFLLILFLFQVSVQAQFFSAGKYSDKDKKAIEEIAQHYTFYEDKTLKEFQTFIRQSLEAERAENPNTAEIINDVFTALKTADRKGELNTASTELFEKAMKNARRENRKDLEIWLSLNYGFYYYTYRKYEKCFPYFMFCIKNLDQTKDRNVVMISDTYRKIAYFLTTNEEYTKAQYYLVKAKKYAPANSSEMASILYSLGYCSSKTQKIQEAEQYYLETLKISKFIGDEVRYAKALGSIAEIEFERKNYDKAIRLLKKDIEISKSKNNDQNTMYALKVLSQIYLATGDLPNAEENIEAARRYSVSKSYFKSSEYEIYQIISKIAQIKGDDVAELKARRRLEEMKDSLKHLDGKDTVLKVAWESQKKQLQLMIEIEKAKNEQESFQKIAAVILSVLLVILIIIIIRSYRHKISGKKAEYETKILQLLLDKIKSENKLNTTNKTVNSYRIYLSEKNRQIEELEEEIEKIRDSSSPFLKEKSDDLQKLLESHLMTNENWNNFRNAFIQKYPSEFRALQNKYPDLTESNLRIIVLTKLNMNNAEIARLLGVTLDAVKKARHRLRKKYGESSEDLFLPVQYMG